MAQEFGTTEMYTDPIVAAKANVEAAEEKVAAAQTNLDAARKKLALLEEEHNYFNPALKGAFHRRAAHHQIPIDQGDKWGGGIHFKGFMQWVKWSNFAHYVQKKVVLNDMEVQEMLDEYFLNHAFPCIGSPHREYYLKFDTFRSVCKSERYPHSFELFREYLAWAATKELKGVNRWKRMVRFLEEEF